MTTLINTNLIQENYNKGLLILEKYANILKMHECILPYSEIYCHKNALIVIQLEEIDDVFGSTYNKSQVVSALISNLHFMNTQLHDKIEKSIQCNTAIIIKRYNQTLNQLKNFRDLQKTTSNVAIQAIRTAILKIPLFGWKQTNKIMFVEHVVLTPINQPIIGGPKLTKYLNFDGMPTTTGDKFIELRVSNSTSRPIPATNTTPEIPGKEQGGCVFQLEDKRELLSMLLASIDEVGLNDLIRTDLNRSKPFPIGGCVLTSADMQYSLMLKLVHINKIGTIRSDSTKIQTLLLGRPVKSYDGVRDLMINSYTMESFSLIRHYLKYSNAVIFKIYTLLESANRIHLYPEVFLRCYRDKCNHMQFVARPSANYHKPFKCGICKIADFCLQCGNNWHIGPCNATSDEMHSFFIANANVNACPKCTIIIERSEGCNHMTCNCCKTEFCWTCLKILVGTESTTHYKNFDARGPCMPVEAESRADANDANDANDTD